MLNGNCSLAAIHFILPFNLFWHCGVPVRLAEWADRCRLLMKSNGHYAGIGVLLQTLHRPQAPPDTIVATTLLNLFQRSRPPCASITFASRSFLVLLLL